MRTPGQSVPIAPEVDSIKAPEDRQDASAQLNHRQTTRLVRSHFHLIHDRPHSLLSTSKHRLMNDLELHHINPTDSSTLQQVKGRVWWNSSWPTIGLPLACDHRDSLTITELMFLIHTRKTSSGNRTDLKCLCKDH
ncbi:hypothetical protein K431DRAFT_282831 [Polychaeton citri CBS 116435]|uniref:Uncharacterized protein n=1 Tax=Polychaeton citri CBS 116435 TaxID=1314669 RepID=A0A9P4QAQ8_9PEZI|nr:hypothetical protein K431DRAFT_282831 [Polychaeton citri CBS 116435]